MCIYLNALAVSGCEIGRGVYAAKEGGGRGQDDVQQEEEEARKWYPCTHHGPNSGVALKSWPTDSDMVHCR